MVAKKKTAKKTPKSKSSEKTESSRTKHAKKTEKTSHKSTSSNWPVLIGVGILILLIAGALIVMEPWQSSVAVINGEPVTSEELALAYALGVPVEQQQLITEMDYLEGYVIPQVIILQQASKEGIEVTDEEVDQAIEELAASQGQTVEQLEQLVIDRGLSKESFRSTMRENLIVSAYLDKKILSDVEVSEAELQAAFVAFGGPAQNITFEEARDAVEQQVQLQKASQAYTTFVQGLVRNSTIIIHPYEKEIRKRFDLTKQELCVEDDRIPLVFFTSSQCESCLASATQLSTLFTGSLLIDLEIWELDTGDNLMTRATEDGIPKERLSYFTQYNKESTVPFTVIGCQYTLRGEISQDDRALIYLLAKLQNER